VYIGVNLVGEGSMEGLIPKPEQDSTDGGWFSRPKEKDEDADVLSPLPTDLKQGGSLQVVHVASSQNLRHSASITSLDIKSPELQHSAAGSCTLVVENEYSATSSPAAEANKLELVTPL